MILKPIFAKYLILDSKYLKKDMGDDRMTIRQYIADIGKEIFKPVMEHAKERFGDAIKRFEKRLYDKVMQIKRKIFASIFELAFYLMSFAFIALAAILFLRRFFPLDGVLIVVGVICLYIAIMLGMIK
jgi:hypothetical protein